VTWHELDAKAQRKALIFGGIVALALLVLLWPKSVSVPHPSRAVAVRNAPQAGRGTPPPRPVPAPDPLVKLLGRWQGAESLPNRGLCTLTLELRQGETPGSFSGFSTLGCMGNVPTGSAKDPMALAEAVRRGIDPTSASFSGTAEGGGIALRATDNIGVSQALQGCDMASMTLKPFGDNRISVRWRETGQAVCAGGEMLLGHAR
jgi:hypothetical protein